MFLRIYIRNVVLKTFFDLTYFFNIKMTRRTYMIVFTIKYLSLIEVVCHNYYTAPAVKPSKEYEINKNITTFNNINISWLIQQINDIITKDYYRQLLKQFLIAILLEELLFIFQYAANLSHVSKSVLEKKLLRKLFT